MKNWEKYIKDNLDDCLWAIADKMICQTDYEDGEVSYSTDAGTCWDYYEAMDAEMQWLKQEYDEEDYDYDQL